MTFYEAKEKARELHAAWHTAAQAESEAQNAARLAGKVLSAARKKRIEAAKQATEADRVLEQMIDRRREKAEASHD